MATGRSWFRSPVIALAVLAFVLVGCASRSTSANNTVAIPTTTASTPNPTTESPSTDQTSTAPTSTAPPTNPPTTKKPKHRALPGPVSPQTPLFGKVADWHALLSAATTDSCLQLIAATTNRHGEHQLDDAIIGAYLGAGEGCAGRLTEAARHLDEAASLLSTLPDDLRENVEPRCGVEQLVSWALFTYLDRDVTLPCPPEPTTTSSTLDPGSTTSGPGSAPSSASTSAPTSPKPTSTKPTSTTKASTTTTKP